MKTSFAGDNSSLIFSSTCIISSIFRYNIEDNECTDIVIHYDLDPGRWLYRQAVEEPLNCGLGFSNNLNLQPVQIIQILRIIESLDVTCLIKQ